MAFSGTGRKHDPQGCALKLMSELVSKGKQVIDVGTGSGVLGIAATKAEAGHCYMCDIDSLRRKIGNRQRPLERCDSECYNRGKRPAYKDGA